MKRKALVTIIIISMLIPNILQSQSIFLKVKVPIASARAEPNVNSTVIRKFQTGTILQSTGRLRDWYEIVVTDDRAESILLYIPAHMVDVVGGDTVREETPRTETPRRAVRDIPYEPERIRPRYQTEQDMSDYTFGFQEGRQAATGSPGWILGGLLCGVFGVIMAYTQKAPPPIEALVGKPADYVLGFTEGYKAKRGKDAGFAWVGWGISGIILLVVLDAEN